MVSTAGSGSVVGRISAIATVGALVGTFLTGFVLLPVAPVRLILLGAAVVLAVTGLAMHLALGRSSGGVVVVLGLAVLGALTVGATATPTCDPESAYYCIRIGRPQSQPAVRDLVLDDLIHGSIDLDEPARLRLRYLRTMDDVIEGARPAPSALTRPPHRRRRLRVAAPPHRGAARAPRIASSRSTPRSSGSTARSSG